MNKDIQTYNSSQEDDRKKICDQLAVEIQRGLPKAESKLWHGAPVWFLGGNPIVGYWVRKNHVQLLFWSGQSFDEEGLQPEGKFKAAEARFTAADQINTDDLSRWLKKSVQIQWDYKNIVKRRSKLEMIN